MVRLRVLIFVMAATICVAHTNEGEEKILGRCTCGVDWSIFVDWSFPQFFMPCRLMWPQSLLEKGDEKAWPVRLVHVYVYYIIYIHMYMYMVSRIEGSLK